MARVLIPLPDRDFDTTEAAVPWRTLHDAGHEVVFATEHGDIAQCDPLLLYGVIFGQLGADADARAAYARMSTDPAFVAPRRWRDLDMSSFDALLLPGGHAPGMRQYLGSADLQQQVARFSALDRPIAAICHGVLVLARARDPRSRASVIASRRTTCLPKYRTYPAYVEDEVRAALASPMQCVRGPLTFGARGSATDHAAAFVVEDGNYLSARWPGDAHLLAQRLAAKLA
jgi:putative intracellular protease/amidase